jgi:hypothetical protein
MSVDSQSKKISSVFDYRIFDPKDLEGGVNLVSVLVGIALAGILFVVFQGFLSGSGRQVQTVGTANDLEALRNAIRITRDCPQTLDAISSWTPGAEAAILRTDGSALIAIPSGGASTQLGDYLVRAFAADVEGKFLIEYTHKQNPPATAVWSDLFPNVPFFCWR